MDLVIFKIFLSLPQALDIAKKHLARIGRKKSSYGILIWEVLPDPE